jgi:hypothetical protein
MPDEPEDRSSLERPPEHLDALFRLLSQQGARLCEPTSEEASFDEETAPGRSGGNRPQIRRVIVRSEDAAANGRVTAVQAALRNGWELVDIALRERPGEEGRNLAFTLRREDCGSERPTR